MLNLFRATTKPQAGSMRAVPQSLADRLAAGPLPIREALRYGIGLAEALRNTHSSGRVYAFLHPSGIVVGDGQVRLVPAVPTALSPYFSPEQVAGRDLDFRSDVFSLGGVLYEMLSSRRAFTGPSKPALRMEILNRAPAPLENVPPTLAHLVQKCLEKKPQRRVQRMEILLAELKLQYILVSGMCIGQPALRNGARLKS